MGTLPKKKNEKKIGRLSLFTILAFDENCFFSSEKCAPVNRKLLHQIVQHDKMRVCCSRFRFGWVGKRAQRDKRRWIIECRIGWMARSNVPSINRTKYWAQTIRTSTKTQCIKHTRNCLPACNVSRVSALCAVCIRTFIERRSNIRLVIQHSGKWAGSYRTYITRRVVFCIVRRTQKQTYNCPCLCRVLMCLCVVNMLICLVLAVKFHDFIYRYTLIFAYFYRMIMNRYHYSRYLCMCRINMFGVIDRDGDNDSDGGDGNGNDGGMCVCSPNGFQIFTKSMYVNRRANGSKTTTTTTNTTYNRYIDWDSYKHTTLQLKHDRDTEVKCRKYEWTFFAVG